MISAIQDGNAAVLGVFSMRNFLSGMEQWMIARCFYFSCQGRHLYHHIHHRWGFHRMRNVVPWNGVSKNLRMDQGYGVLLPTCKVAGWTAAGNQDEWMKWMDEICFLWAVGWWWINGKERICRRSGKNDWNLVCATVPGTAVLWLIRQFSIIWIPK